MAISTRKHQDKYTFDVHLRFAEDGVPLSSIGPVLKGAISEAARQYPVYPLSISLAGALRSGRTERVDPTRSADQTSIRVRLLCYLDCLDDFACWGKTTIQIEPGAG
eukprot:gene2914-biopygen1379